MDPSRKRKIRLVVALGLAVVLAISMVVVSLGAATEAKTPSEILAASEPGKSYDVTGTVKDGSVHYEGDTIQFEVRDRDGSVAVPVDYMGPVPDPFREGREVIVTGEMSKGTFVAAALTTKCPSKFTAEEPS